MKKYIRNIAVLLSLAAFFSCDKNKEFDGRTTLTGRLYLADSINQSVPTPIARQKVYVNTGNDTSTYVYILTTDSTGSFSIPSVDGSKTFILFSNFTRNGVSYRGATKLSGSRSDKLLTGDVYVYPAFTNGAVVLFTDPFGTPVTNLPFRLYTSRSAALVDSLKNASLDTVSNSRGQFERYNANPVSYYIVSKKIFGTDTLKIFDSITIPPIGINRKKVMLHP